MVEASAFRRVLGCYPTGVCVVAALDENDAPVGLAIGSFASASLDPPLIGFFPDKKSASWPLIERAGRFCVNVLASDQREICERFAQSGGDKFADIDYSLSANGSPLIEGVVAWIDCALHTVAEAGDHYIVLGRALDLGAGRNASALLFFRGRYGAFADTAVV
jgi:flavin reductase (DIM6/NTAB) family NADH-FMN oxidoreductase RutF